MGAVGALRGERRAWGHRLVVLVCFVLLVVGPSSVQGAANTPPVAVDDPSASCSGSAFGGSFPIAEDWKSWFILGGSTCGPLANDHDPDGDQLTLVLAAQPSSGEAIALSDGSIAYKVEPDFSTLEGYLPGGTWISTSIPYRAFDGTAYSNQAVYKLWIAPVNDPPSFAPGPSLVAAYVGGSAVAVEWATNIRPGPPNESHQLVSFEMLSIDHPGAPSMFSVAPTIDAAGVLRFTPGSEPGLATITVRARDNGGLVDYNLSSNPDFVPPKDVSDAVTFQIVVYAPAATPTPTPTPKLSPTPKPTSSPTSMPTPTSTPTPSPAAPGASPTATPTIGPTPTPTAEGASTPSKSPIPDFPDTIAGPSVPTPSPMDGGATEPRTLPGTAAPETRDAAPASTATPVRSSGSSPPPLQGSLPAVILPSSEPPLPPGAIVLAAMALSGAALVGRQLRRR